MILLRVPEEYLGSINARRVYYSAAVDGKIKSRVDQFEVWVQMGTPEALGTFERIPQVQIVGRFVVNDKQYRTRGRYDYFDLGIDTSSPGMPKRFTGMSGGGLWKVLVYRSRSTGRIDWVRRLEGVAFFELLDDTDRVVIRCHGPKSVRAMLSMGKRPARRTANPVRR